MKHTIVHINSRYRNNYLKTSASDYFYQFPRNIKDVHSMRLRSVNIPQSMYNVSKKKGNNEFKIRTYHRSTMCEKIIKLPDGNWKTEALIFFLNDYFQNCGNLKYIRFSINEIIKKSHFNIRSNAPKDFKFDLIFANEDKSRSLTSEFGWLLGFRMGKYINVEHIESESPFRNTNGIIYISINDFNYNRNDSNWVFTDTACLDKDILGKIYTSKHAFSINIADSDGLKNQKIRNYIKPVTISKIHTQIFDEDGNIIDLNNMDWSFSLEFLCVK